MEELLELARENNRMLRAMRRASFWGGVFRIIWWALIVGVPIWLYYHLWQPYLDSLHHAANATPGFGQYLSQLPAPLREFLKILGFNV